MNEVVEKLCKKAVTAQEYYKLTSDEKRETMRILLANKTQRALSKELGIPKSTIQDWYSGRQCNTGKHIHLSLDQFYLKVIAMTKDDVKDWHRLKQIYDKIGLLLESNRLGIKG